MAVSDPFFQFPVKALRTGHSIPEVDNDPTLRLAAFDQVMVYGIIHFAKSVQSGENGWGDSLDRNDWHQCVERSAYHLTYDSPAKHDRAGTPEDYAQRVIVPAEKAADWLERYETIEAIVGGLTLVRVRKDILLDFATSRTWREFAILAAVYASIGKATYRLVRQGRFEFLAAGYSSRTEANANPGFCPVGLTRRQIQATVDKLANQTLFVKALPNRRDCYYSNSMTLLDLAEQLAKQHRERKGKPTMRDVTSMIRKGDVSALEKSKPAKTKPQRGPLDRSPSVHRQYDSWADV